ncbi:MAG: hypothetical protein AB1Z98_16165, partial [Nannocystaceae bacterium]
MTDRDWLRRAFEQIPGEGDPATAVDPELIWSAVHGRLDPEQTAALVDRLHHDPQLALEWRMAVQLADDRGAAESEPEPEPEPKPESEPEPNAPVQAQPTAATEPAANDRRYWLVALLGAAAAAALVFVMRPSGQPSEPSSPPEPGSPAASGAVMRAPAVETPLTTPLADGATLPREQVHLRWSEVPDADHYQLQVSTAALDPLYRARDLPRPEATVPADALDDVESGSTLVWRVIAVMPDGSD